MKIVWEQLRLNYDRKTATQMLEESFTTRKLVYKCGEYGIVSVTWENDMIASIKSVEGQIFIRKFHPFTI